MAVIPLSEPDASGGLHQLRVDQAFHTHLNRGACIHIDSGAFRLVRREWLAGQCAVTARRLETGDIYCADASGWIVLEALPGSPAAFLLTQAPRLRWQRLLMAQFSRIAALTHARAPHKLSRPL